MVDYEAISSQAEGQFICQVRGCRKLFVEAIQIEAHLKHHRNYIPTNGIFECKCCPESYTRKEQLDQHTLNEHTYDGLMRLQQPPQAPISDVRHQVRHGVHGSHLRQDVIRQPMQPPRPIMVSFYQTLEDH
jgi:hypothetical protein